MNYLKAVFWDYPQFTDKVSVEKYLRDNEGSSSYLWMLRRFLEYGRVVDTVDFFDIDEISERLPELKLSAYAKKKWKRLLEVYRGIQGR